MIAHIETNVGHGAGTPVSKTIDAAVDQMSFILFNMGVEELRSWGRGRYGLRLLHQSELMLKYVNLKAKFFLNTP